MAVLAGLYVVGSGLGHTFQIELTDEAVREQERGFRMIRLGSLGLLVVAGYGVVRGARTLTVTVVAAVPVLCGGLSEAAPESLFPHLVFLVAAPLAGLAALIGVFLPWRSHRREPAADAS